MEPVVTTTGARHGTTADDTGPQTLMMLTATTTTAVQEVITAFAQLASWIMRRDAGGEFTHRQYPVVVVLVWHAGGGRHGLYCCNQNENETAT